MNSKATRLQYGVGHELRVRQFRQAWAYARVAIVSETKTSAEGNCTHQRALYSRPRIPTRRQLAAVQKHLCQNIVT